MHVELGSKDLTTHTSTSISMEEITQSEAAHLLRLGILLSLFQCITESKNPPKQTEHQFIFSS